MLSDRSFGKPYWWEEAPPEEGDGASLPASVDVLIVGSGFTGLSAALTLIRAGRSVLICESHLIGHGASTRNGGQVGSKVRPGLGGLIETLGEGPAIAVAREAMAARKYIGDLVEAEKLDCDFVASPRFNGAHRKADFTKLAKTAELMREKLSFPISVVPESEQHRIVNTDAYHGGVLDHSTAMFHPGKYVRELARLVQREGVRIATSNPVTRVEKEQGGFTVETERGIVTARNVIVATNGYSGPALQYFRERIIPIGSYIVATDPLPTSLVREIMPACDMIIDSRRAASYMRISPDRRRLIYGGRVAAVDISPTKSGPRLKAVLDRIFPKVREVGFSHSWMGFTGFTFDQLPHIGSVNGIHFVMGYNGTSGTSLGTYLGRKVALKVMGDEEGRTAFDDISFSSNPLYSGTPWFLSSMVAFYRLRDWLKV